MVQSNTFILQGEIFWMVWLRSVFFFFSLRIQMRESTFAQKQSKCSLLQGHLHPDTLNPMLNCEMSSDHLSCWPGSLSCPVLLWPHVEYLPPPPLDTQIFGRPWNDSLCYQHLSDTTVGSFPFIRAIPHICSVEWLCSVLMKSIEAWI